MKSAISCKLFFLGLLVSLILVPNIYAQSAEPKEIEEIVVWGRETDLVGSADSASDGIVGYDDILDRPLTRVGELVEFIPGMIAVMHSGGGKANQYFLRGINLDHGTDFSINFDGMPVNLRSHAHGNGYLDMNFIIPELVETITYSKGTHHAEQGDFSSAGSSDFKTYDQLEHGTVKFTWGSEKHQRLFMANSWDTGPGTFLMGGTIKKYDGPLLVIHAEEDHIVPFSQGELLYDFSPSENKTFIPIPKANHNNILDISFQKYFDES